MRNPVQEYLEDLVEQCGSVDGEVSTVVPELAEADPDRFALALATVDGHVYGVGETDLRFSIQSISKPFTYALALAEHGAEVVDEKLDVEPSGEAFNEISLAGDTGRPRNPMINAGAIAAAALVPGTTVDDRFERLRGFYSACAGRDLEMDERIWRSERDTAHRNRAIAHLLREFDVIEGDPEAALDTYLRQCSLAVDVRDLAIMAATLANGGLQPCTRERLLSTETNERVLSVMATCGMYDAAGDWLSAVGMPAKSGVSGGIIAVLPGQVGVAVFSPPLDPHGNSARGVAVCEQMSRDMELHLMHVGRGSRSAVRAAYPLSRVAATRRRTDADTRALEGLGARARVYELHGDLMFAEAENVVRRVVTDAPEIAVVDVSRIDDVAHVARETLLGLRGALGDDGAEYLVVDPDGVLVDDSGTAAQEGEARTFSDLGSAVIWAEDELLRRHREEDADPGERPVDQHPLLHDLSDDARSVVLDALEEVHVAEGEEVLAAGSGFAGVHLIVTGEAVALAEDEDGGRHVLLTMMAGTSFGELALGTDDVQETAVRAASDLELLRLSSEALAQISSRRPEVAVEVWRAVARDGYRLADRALRAAGSAG